MLKDKGDSPASLGSTESLRGGGVSALGTYRESRPGMDQPGRKAGAPHVRCGVQASLLLQIRSRPPTQLSWEQAEGHGAFPRRTGGQ